MLRLYGPGCDGSIVDHNHAGARPDGVIWIDLEEPTRADEKLVERWLGIDIPTRDDLAEIEPSSRLYESDGALYMTLSALLGVTEGEPASEPIGFVLADDHLVTVRYATPKPVRAFVDHVRRQPELARDALAVFLGLIDAIVDRLADELEASGTEIKGISSEVFRRTRASERRIEPRRLELLLIRIGKAQELLATIRLTAVSASRLVAFFSGSSRLQEPSLGAAHERVRSIGTDLEALISYSGFLADNLIFLLDASLGLISVEQNAAMKLFSWVAVVLLPPTLIAGIFGMNFHHFPQLDWYYGFPISLGLIAASAVLPYIYFRHRGWL